MTAPALSHAFREASRCHPAGVAVIAAEPGNGPAAMTVSSLISVIADPPEVAFSRPSRSGSATAVLAARSMILHLLRHADLDLALLGAKPGADRCGTAPPWEHLPSGGQCYTAVTTWFGAQITSTLAATGATVVTAKLRDGVCGPPAGAPELESLICMDRRGHRLHETPDGSASLTLMNAEYRDVFR